MDVLLADDRKVRLALRVLLEQIPGLTVVGEAANARDLFVQTSAMHPDLVLLDWTLPGLDEDGTLLTLRQIHPEVSVIVLSGRPEARKSALAAGANAYVSKVEPPERLLTAIDKFVSSST
jgi:DNA-binding NarL/FixJ family response regulator